VATPAESVARKVLVVDDEENIRLVLQTLLRKHGYEVHVASSAERALAQLDELAPEFVLADVRMPGMSGIELCGAIRARGGDVNVIVMSAYGSVDLALESMKAGAYDYVQKPFKQDEVLLVLAKAAEREALRRENRALKEAVRHDRELSELLGESEAIRHVLRLIDKVADYRTTVLIQGESGTGKELVARALHKRSSRAERPFVAINCGAIPEALMESELFGHKRGAFTDAHSDKRGIFQEADQGTLFLDEVGELTPPLQVKLLRALQESVVRPLGGTKDVAVDVRVVAATVRDLRKEIAAGRFRDDLYYRLNVLQISVPPLRDRLDDIPLLVEHFLRRNNKRLGTHITGIDAAVRKRLLSYGWPGNVRELENLIERASVLADGEVLTLADVGDRLHAPTDALGEVLGSNELSIKKATRTIEDTLIRRALERTRGNRTAAAKLLEISHRALLYKIKDYGVS
jgi:two-component system, NtrC family, response regulator AtoC